VFEEPDRQAPVPLDDPRQVAAHSVVGRRREVVHHRGVVRVLGGEPLSDRERPRRRPRLVAVPVDARVSAEGGLECERHVGHPDRLVARVLDGRSHGYAVPLGRQRHVGDSDASVVGRTPTVLVGCRRAELPGEHVTGVVRDRDLASVGVVRDRGGTRPAFVHTTLSCRSHKYPVTRRDRGTAAGGRNHPNA